mmetsp:Transcript_3191/g.19731  ORF Transcript_3191/g.19731 Transcript_3191/m.19731 type:complete len:118 (-) Transcript_3191:307-660(-)
MKQVHECGTPLYKIDPSFHARTSSSAAGRIHEERPSHPLLPCFALCGTPGTCSDSNLASLPCVVRKRKRLLSLSIFFRSAVDSVLYCRHWAKGEGMDASGQRVRYQVTSTDASIPGA